MIVALDGRPMRELLARRPAEVDAAGQDPRAQVDVPADLDVVEHGHALEQGDVLEGPRDPELGAPVRLEAGDVVPVEADVAARGRVDAADAVEDAGLARAVGADDGEEVAGVDLEAHARPGRPRRRS